MEHQQQLLQQLRQQERATKEQVTTMESAEAESQSALFQAQQQVSRSALLPRCISPSVMRQKTEGHDTFTFCKEKLDRIHCASVRRRSVATCNIVTLLCL